ncbi:anion exchange protein 3-like [Ranitomeya imitator]|uniref:anion exchange protein 3-like n=1 Tax=Ranitomeya imitator TaxID=111125 RepID=UPI0037E99433
MAARRRDPPMGIPELKFLISTMDGMHKAQIVKKWGDLKSKSPARLQELRREIRREAKTQRRRHEASHTASAVPVPSGSTPPDPKAKTQRRRHEASHTASAVPVPSSSTPPDPKAKTQRRRRQHEAFDTDSDSETKVPYVSMPPHPKAKTQRRHHEASQSAQYWPPDALPGFSPSENMSPDEVLPPAGSVTILDLKTRIERLCETVAQIQEQQNVAIGELQKIRDMCQQLEAGQ